MAAKKAPGLIMATVISIVSYPFLPAKNGGQKNIALFYKYFSRLHALTCIGAKKNDPGSAAGYSVIPLLSDSPLRYINLFYFFSVRKIIRREKASHLLLEHPYYGWLGLLLKRFCGVKLIVRSHNMEGLRWKSLGKWWWKILWLYERATHRSADYNFFIQEDDYRYAIQHFGLEAAKCTVITYGIEIDSPPPVAERNEAGKQLRERYGIPAWHTLLLFNGAYQYAPNLEALRIILAEIRPRLIKKGFPHTLLVCGSGIPGEILAQASPEFIIAGFVDRMEPYLLGADIFLNPVVLGGGIKTKLVEALGYGMNAVSTTSGAAGIDPTICDGKLGIAPDRDWDAFAGHVAMSGHLSTPMGAAYYRHFYWGSAAAKAASFIE
jgi:polysaccharide biosynthesis protein PslH